MGILGNSVLKFHIYKNVKNPEISTNLMLLAKKYEIILQRYQKLERQEPGKKQTKTGKAKRKQRKTSEEQKKTKTSKQRGNTAFNTDFLNLGFLLFFHKINGKIFKIFNKQMVNFYQK